MITRSGILILAVGTVLLSGCADSNDTSVVPGNAEATVDVASGADSIGNATTNDDIARGREQLIRAFDTGWIRFVASGKIDEILASEPPNKPGAAADYVIKLADCLPSPELAQFPEQPVGILKKILDTGTIRKLVQAVPNTPGDTSYYFSGISEKYMQGVLDEISGHYGIDLEVEAVAAKPGRLPSTSYLLDDEVDFVSQLNATGGVTQGMRRRISRRYTCTMSASTQFIHIPTNTELAGQINSWRDLVARTDVRICAGPLSTQTVRAFLPNHEVKTIYINDLPGCARQIEKDKVDVIINPLPDLAVADMLAYKSVPTMIVAGTPLWVALEGIECPADGDPKTEDECFETNPL